MWRMCRLAVLGLALLWPAPSPAESTGVPLIPLGDFFASGTPQWGFQVSPDGTRLAWAEVPARRAEIVVRHLDTGQTERIGVGRAIRGLRWAEDGRHLLFRSRGSAGEDEHLFVADAGEPDRPPVNLTPYPGVTVRTAQMWPWEAPFLLRDDPDHVLVVMNRRDRSLFDLHRIDLRTGETTLVAENPGDVVRWLPDPSGTLVARMRRRADGGWYLDGPAPGRRWRTLVEGEPEAEFTPVRVDPDGPGLWAVSSHDRDKAALVRIDLTDGAVTFEHAVADVDVTWASVDDRTNRPVEAWSCPDYCRAHIFDDGLARDLDRLRTDATDYVAINSADRGYTRLVVQVESDRAGTSHHLLDRTTGAARVLRPSPVAGLATWLSPVEPVAFPSRDGLTLHGYLTRPAVDGGEPRPMVLLVHGGPWSRDYWGYDPQVQFLANRGYAVLQVNYRGSTGYGRAFVRASKRQMARRMHDDLVDGVQWAITHGIAAPSRIAIMGTSYGGYATLVGMTFTPELFAAGVDIVGAADTVMLLETLPASWRQRLPFWRTYYGDPDDPADRAEMATRSPINYVDRMARPLLVIQGERDVRVVKAQSEAFVTAARAAGKDVEYLGFPDEGHFILKRQNRLAMHRRIERFLAEHLGGRSMP